MEDTFHQKLSPGDLVYIRDWDVVASRWVTYTDRVFLVVDAKRDPSDEKFKRDIISVVHNEFPLIESYAGYFVKVNV